MADDAPRVSEMDADQLTGYIKGLNALSEQDPQKYALLSEAYKQLETRHHERRSRYLDSVKHGRRVPSADPDDPRFGETAEMQRQVRPMLASAVLPDEDASTAPVSTPDESPVSEPPRPTGTPTLEEFIAANKDANPDYSPEEMARIWDATYGERGSHLPTLDEFLAANKEANPDYTADEMTEFWREQYGSRGALEHAPGIGHTLWEGAKGTVRSLKAYAGTLLGDTEGVIEAGKESTQVVRDPNLARLLRDIDQKKHDLGPDASWFDVGSAVGKAMLEHPAGAAHLFTEQLPNTATMLGTAAIGGAVAGPIGALAGMFLSNIGLETGGKAVEAGAQGTVDRETILKEGGIKGAIVSAVDALTFGATKWMTGTTSRALEAATIRTLMAEGVDVTDRTAVLAAAKNPAISEKVLQAQKTAIDSVTTFGQKAARGTAELGLESVGEGVGEYLGELAATGQGDKAEAFIEAFAGLGQSTAEIGVSSAWNKRSTPTADIVTRAGEASDQTNKIIAEKVTGTGTVDEAIDASKKIVSEPVAVKPEDIGEFIDKQEGAFPYTPSQLAADQHAFESVFATYGAKHGFTRDASGLSFNGTRLTVIDPNTLPDTAPDDDQSVLTKGRFEAIGALMQAQGKRLVIYDNTQSLGFQGVVNPVRAENTVFLGTRGTFDPTYVAFHEAAHLMQGTPLYTAFQQTVVQNLRPGARAVALGRHGTGFKQRVSGESSSDRKRRIDLNLINEVSADIAGDAMGDPEFLKKVIARMQEQVGPQEAHNQVQTFLDKIKGLLSTLTDLISGRRFQTREGYDAVRSYVKNLEMIHDALAVAVADLYVKQGKVYSTTQQSAEAQFSGTRSETTERLVIPPDVVQAFRDTGSTRRQAEQGALTNLHRVAGKGILTATTDASDRILSAMMKVVDTGSVNRSDVIEQINRALKYLEHAYGFEKEHALNTERNALYYNVPTSTFRRQTAEALSRYADAVRETKVYNYPQWLAKQASMAMGQQQWDRAKTLLRSLKQLASSDGFAKAALAYERDAQGALKEYLHAVPGSLIAKAELGSVGLAPTEQAQAYHLREATPHTPAGTRVTQQEMRDLGYRVVPDHLMTEDEDAARRAAIEKGESPETSTKPESKKETPSVEMTSSIDEQAHEAATSPTNGHPEPTVAQKEAGNYKKGHIEISGLEISIENPEGSTRSGTDPNGKPWSITMRDHYGYFLGTVGRDKDHIDVFVEPGTDPAYNGPVFVVTQKNPSTGKFDEHKVVIGPGTKEAARNLYLRNYAKGWKGYDGIQKFSMEDFKTWLADHGMPTTTPETTPAREFVKEDRPLFSPAPVFVSHLINTLDLKMPNRASAEQIRAILSEKNGVKVDEMKWMGMDDFLKRKDVFTKEEILDFARANQVQIQEVVKGEEKNLSIEEAKDILQRGGNVFGIPKNNPESSVNITLSDGKTILPSILRNSTNYYLREGREEDFTNRKIGTKFSQYQLPGGEDYRELLLTLPVVKQQLKDWKAERFGESTGADYEGWSVTAKMANGQTFSSEITIEDAGTPEAAITLGKQVAATHEITDAPGTSFRSSHFSEPNILAHVRFNTRTVDGKKVLFLEEVQSDWHQAGRKKGYDSGPQKKYRVVSDDVNLTAEFDTREEAEAEIAWAKKQKYPPVNPRIVEFETPSGLRKGVPEAPFKKTWHEMALRRMLRYAAENDYDALAWTTGEQQAERYDLSKHVEDIGYQKRGELYNVTVWGKDGERLWQNQSATLQEVEDTVGKEVADKMQKGEGTNKGDLYYLSGLDLKVGGEGMKGFYDKIIQAYLNKYGKKWGAQVDRLVLNGIKQEPGVGIHTDNLANILDEKAKAALQPVLAHSLPITDSMRQSVMEQGQPLFSLDDRRIPTPYEVEQPGWLDKIIRVLQDKNIDIKRVVEAIQKTGATIPDDVNAVLKEEMYQKRVEQRTTDFANDELRPVIEKMKLEKVTLGELDRFLHARHVINDRLNARLKQINPDMPNNEALSGMSDEDANAILNGYSPDRRRIMNELGNDIDAMVEKTRELMLDYGLERQQTIDSWRKTYRSYVPLRREGFDEQGHPTGTGRSVRGSTAHDRLGSNRAVENILANIAQARDQVITRGEKMRPVIAFAGLLMMFPNKQIAALSRPAEITVTDPVTGLTSVIPGDVGDYKVPMIRRFNPVLGEVVSIPDPLYKGRPNVVNFRIKGRDYAIIFNEKDERAMEVAKAFKELDVPKLTGVMKAVAPYTRYLASINTQYNPIFGLVNFVRDAQFAALTLAGTPLDGQQAEVIRNARRSLWGIFDDARSVRHGLHPNSSTAQLWERFQHVGGPAGYRDLYMTASDRAAEIERLLDPNTWKHLRNPQDLAKRLEDSSLFQLLSDYNLAMENAIRLGVFKTGVERGMSDLQAASLAKNITVNFNKRGQIGAQMGSLYAFFNASVQGTARILETLFERTPEGGSRLTSVGKKIISGGILIGVLQAFMLAVAGFEDDEPPEYIKDRNLVIPAPWTDKGYLTLPMPLGFNLLPNIGRVAAETLWAEMAGKPPKLMEKAFSLAGSFMNAFAPTGGSGDILSELAPTVVDPIVALKTNRDWTGKAISREDLSSLKPTPGHTRARDTSTVWAMAMSRGINWATGGTDYVPGMLSPTPDAIDYFIQQATGGVGREFSKFAQVGRSLYTGEELPFYKIPVAGRFMGSSSGSGATRERFYDNIRAVNLAAEEAKGRATHHEDLSSFLKENPEGRLEKAAISVERAIGKLNRRKHEMIKEGVSRSEVQLKDEQILHLMEQFNRVVAEAKKL